MNTNQIARIAGLLGEPARTAMLIELMGGRALTASEMARAAAISASTASAHLAQLMDAQLLRVTPSGRHRYYRLASPEIARLIGRLGVAITERLVNAGGLVLDEEQATLNERGRRALAELGIELPPGGAQGSRREDPASCRPCLDWSERRHHIAGRLASHICRAFVQRGWIQRRAASRAVDVTPPGRMALQAWLGLELWAG